MTSQGKHLTHRPCTTLSDQPLTLLDGIVSSTSGMGDSGHKVPCEVLIKSEQGSAVVKSFRARENIDHVITFDTKNIYTFMHGRQVRNAIEIEINYDQSLPREAVEWS